MFAWTNSRFKCIVIACGCKPEVFARLPALPSPQQRAETPTAFVLINRLVISDYEAFDAWDKSEQRLVVG